MDYGEQTTGTRDEHYNLVSVLYHALQGAENCDRYAADAEVTGEEHMAAFFREAQVMQAQLAERAKELLGIPESPPEFGATPGGVSSGTARRRFPSQRGADAEGGATTGGGEAREAGGGAHDAADPARRTTGGRGEAREAYTVVGDSVWREEMPHERRAVHRRGQKPRRARQ
jgi:hypothetical protein